MNRILKILSIVLATAFCASCAHEGDTYLIRETDRISFSSCVASVRKISLRCKGDWKTVVETGSEWISTSPQSGTGDGSFCFVEVRVDNNRGLAREGTFYFECGGEQYRVDVSQAEGKIRWSNPELSGNLIVDNVSDVSIQLGYESAFGDETVRVSCSIEGASAGITIPARDYNLGEGSGFLSIPIEGTPLIAGYADIDVSVDGSSAGSIRAKVYSLDELPLEGLPVQWDFCEVQGTSADADALKARQADWSTLHVLHSDKGSAEISIEEASGKTAEPVNSFAYNNGHAYFKGLYNNDAILITIPVKNLKTGTQFTLSGSIGGSGSSPAFLLIEYSTDGENWSQAAGASTKTLLEKTFSYHAQVFDSYLASDGAFSCTFPVDDTMLAGYLRIRMRVCVNIRVTLASSITTGGGGSTRLKGSFKVTAAE